MGEGLRRHRSGGHDAPVTPQTLFQAASLSKPVAALAALRLVEQGKLALDQDVNERLTSWKVPENEFTKTEKVTLRRLLSHSAGLTVSGFPGYSRRRSGSGARPGARRPEAGQHRGDQGRRRSRHHLALLRRRLHGDAATADGRHRPALPVAACGPGAAANRHEGQHLRAAAPGGEARGGGERPSHRRRPSAGPVPHLSGDGGRRLVDDADGSRQVPD